MQPAIIRPPERWRKALSKLLALKEGCRVQPQNRSYSNLRKPPAWFTQCGERWPRPSLNSATISPPSPNLSASATTGMSELPCKQRRGHVFSRSSGQRPESHPRTGLQIAHRTDPVNRAPPAHPGITDRQEQQLRRRFVARKTSPGLDDFAQRPAQAFQGVLCIDHLADSLRERRTSAPHAPRRAAKPGPPPGSARPGASQYRVPQKPPEIGTWPF